MTDIQPAWKSEMQESQYKVEMAVLDVIMKAAEKGLNSNKVVAAVILTAIENACEDTGFDGRYAQLTEELVRQADKKDPVAAYKDKLIDRQDALIERFIAMTETLAKAIGVANESAAQQPMRTNITSFTNGDYLRASDDNAIADVFKGLAATPEPGLLGSPECKQKWLDWLRQTHITMLPY